MKIVRNEPLVIAGSRYERFIGYGEQLDREFELAYPQ